MQTLSLRSPTGLSRVSTFPAMGIRLRANRLYPRTQP
jgi:hypothetical protein